MATDIQEAVDYYKEKQKPLGRRFYDAVKKSIQSLEKEALLYQIRYKKIRCRSVEKFPYLIHYHADTNTNSVHVYAVICTYKSPEDSWVNS